MFERVKRAGAAVERLLDPDAVEGASLMPLRTAAAQLLMTAGMGAAMEFVGRDEYGREAPLPPALGLAPALIAPLAAVAQLERARRPGVRTAAAATLLGSAAIAAGGALVLGDLITSRGRGVRRIAPLAFASAGVLTLCLERQEREIRQVEHTLRRRADVVERLVPARRAKVDRIVVHV